MPLAMQAQKINMNDYDWHKGLIMADENNFQGLVAYDDRYDVVYLKSEETGQVKTFATHQVDTVKIFNRDTRVTHIYANYPVTNKYGFEVREMFEEIIVGPVSYLKKGTFENLSQYQGNIGIAGNTKTIDLVKYYLYYDNTLEEIKNFEKQILKIFDISRKDLRRVLKRYSIKIESPRGEARCVYHLNEMLAAEEVALNNR